ncbi:MAG: hypothetical protein HFJ43_03190 [Clostridia bacterium]|nr:hypothetical protein [Clostridia bacterium]
MRENKVNSNIHISINNGEEIKHITLLYGNPDRKLPKGVSVLDIIKDCLTEDEYKEYEELFTEHLKTKPFTNEIKRKIDYLDIPKKLHYYELGELSNCHFFIKDHFSIYERGTNLIDFLNTNFSNFDEYFVWFTKFFTSYIKYFEKSDMENLKIDKSYSYDEIENLGQKYFKLIKKDAIKVQRIYSEFVDYIFNKHPLENSRTMTNQMRFYIYYTSHFKTLKPYVTDFKIDDAFNYKIFPEYLETSEDKLLEFFTTGQHFADVYAETNSTSSSVYTILYITLFKFVEENNFIIKKCKNCSKYFITDNPRVNYCNNLFKGKQTCRDIGNQIAQKIKQENDKVYGKYRKMHSKKAMLVKRNPDIEVYKKDYENWKKEAKKFMDDIRSDKKTYEEFDKWLDENK